MHVENECKPDCSSLASFCLWETVDTAANDIDALPCLS